MTIQKTSEIGILKAIGITTKHLLTSLILQISMITFIGVAIAEVVILLISNILPVSMPFHIDMQNIIFVLVVFMIVGLIGTSLSFIKLIKIDPMKLLEVANNGSSC